MPTPQSVPPERIWAIPKKEDVRNNKIHSLQWIPFRPLVVIVGSPTLAFADSGDRNEATTSEGVFGLDPCWIERLFQIVNMETSSPRVVILKAISSLIGE